jgi:hypothetical protein
MSSDVQVKIESASGGYVRRRPDSYFFFAVFLTERLRAAALLRRAGFLPRFAVDLRRDFALTAILGLLEWSTSGREGTDPADRRVTPQRSDLAIQFPRHLTQAPRPNRRATCAATTREINQLG